jgi:maltose alpha-D-glucosyltransferase/alpha-amylase
VKRRKGSRGLSADPLWYKDAIIYELHVRAFNDSDGDGIGDLPGLTAKLDYLEQLGVTAIWLLPFYPSPLRDDGYDIADYYDIHPRYGKLRDFEAFMKEAHRRGLRVITELVVNHTSDQHAWFQRARKAKPGSSHRDFYVWSDTPDRYQEARIIFKDFEHSNWSYDPVAKSYYWHRFYAHQPDLNYDNPAVQKAVFQVVDFWMAMGVDGMRLDAVPYVFEREGTDCENLPETHAFLKKLRRHLDQKHPNRMLLAEANQWPEDAAAYFGDGDECHMNFHFPLMPRLFMSIQMEDRFPILDILKQTPEIAESSQWALFLRNHDELTLEMVTDEERDYMYRVYALDQQARINLGIRRRLAPLLRNNRRAIELMNALLFALPGTPVIYYGDELGMGDNIFLGDRNGVRTPMQWSADRNAGFSRANPQGLYLPVIIDPEYHFETINVEAQSNNPNSLLWWMRNMIALRKRHKAFGRGTIEFLEPDNRKVLAFVRQHERDVILVVANLSRFVQFAELDLSAFAGRRPVELFGRTEFPPVDEEPYLLTLGPHTFYWFSLKQDEAVEVETSQRPLLEVDESWAELVDPEGREELEGILPEYLLPRRWFAGKARVVVEAEIRDALPLGGDGARWIVTLVTVHYTDGDPETYQLPLAFADGERAAELQEEAPHAVIARVRADDGAEGVLFDAVYDPAFALALYDAIERRRKLAGERGTAHGSRTRALAGIRRGAGELAEPHVGTAEQSNSSIVFGDQLILKIYRRVDEGTNPDLEVGRFLLERTRFKSSPAVAGSLEYRHGRSGEGTLAFLQGYVANQGDAWTFTVDEVERFLERAAAHPEGAEIPLPGEGVGMLQASQEDSPEAARAMLGTYAEPASLLGRRTAELHVALASDDEDPDFRPEPFTPFARRALYQSVRGLARRTFQTLRARLGDLPEDVRRDARELLKREDELLDTVQATLSRKIGSPRMRIHGDYHLGQVLYTGRDFVIIDFEGEPARPISERRLKRSPLRDVAGMLRSFHYAALVALHQRIARRIPIHGDSPLPAWARAWRFWAGAEFLRSYLEGARRGELLAETSLEEISALLDVYRLEKAVYELVYELNNRPTWVGIPVAGIMQVLRETGEE